MLPLTRRVILQYKITFIPFEMLYVITTETQFITTGTQYYKTFLYWAIYVKIQLIYRDNNIYGSVKDTIIFLWSGGITEYNNSCTLAYIQCFFLNCFQFTWHRFGEQLYQTTEKHAKWLNMQFFFQLCNRFIWVENVFFIDKLLSWRILRLCLASSIRYKYQPWYIVIDLLTFKCLACLARCCKHIYLMRIYK